MVTQKITVNMYTHTCTYMKAHTHLHIYEGTHTFQRGKKLTFSLIQTIGSNDLMKRREYGIQ